MQKNNVLELIRLHSKGKGELSVDDVNLMSSSRQGLVTLQFKVFSSANGPRSPIPGVEIVSKLRGELEADPELLGLPVLSIDTLVCQNTCSGHGTCDQVTRDCVCDAAWTENWISRQMMGGQPNCDWSLVYVGLAAGSVVLIIIVCCCLTTCKRKVVKLRAKRKYSRLNTGDNVEMRGTFLSLLLFHIVTNTLYIFNFKLHLRS